MASIKVRKCKFCKKFFYSRNFEDNKKNTYKRMTECLFFASDNKYIFEFLSKISYLSNYTYLIMFSANKNIYLRLSLVIVINIDLFWNRWILFWVSSWMTKWIIQWLNWSIVLINFPVLKFQNFTVKSAAPETTKSSFWKEEKNIINQIFIKVWTDEGRLH